LKLSEIQCPIILSYHWFNPGKDFGYRVDDTIEKLHHNRTSFYNDMATSMLVTNVGDKICEEI